MRITTSKCGLFHDVLKGSQRPGYNSQSVRSPICILKIRRTPKSKYSIVWIKQAVTLG